MKPVCTDILLANGDEPNLIFRKFARLVYSFFSSAWYLQEKIQLDENSEWFCISVWNFSLQNITGLDAGLDGKI